MTTMRTYITLVETAEAGSRVPSENDTPPAVRYIEKALRDLWKTFRNSLVVSLEAEGDRLVYIGSIDAATQGRGSGERALKKLTKLADEFGITLTLDVSSDLDDDLLVSDSGRLVSWYRWYGFRVSGQDSDRMMTLTHMIREPHASPDDTALRDTLVRLAVSHHGEDKRTAVVDRVSGLPTKDLRGYLRHYRGVTK